MVQNAAHRNIVLAPVGGLLNTATHVNSGLSLHQQPIPFIPSGSLVDKEGMNTEIPNGDVPKSTHEVNTGDKNGAGNNAKPNIPNTGDPVAKPDIEKEVKKGEEKDESPMAKDLKGDESVVKEKEFVNREKNDRKPIVKDLKGETDESNVEKEDKVLNKKDRSPIAKDLKGEESSIAKEKEVVNREKTDRNPIAKDLKGDTDESTVDKGDKVLDKKDRSPVSKDLQGEERSVANKKEVAKEKEVVNSQQEKDRSPIAKDLKGEESSIANEKEVTKVKEVVKSQQENDRSPVAKDLKGDSESSVEKKDKVITNEKEKEVITSEPKEEDVDDAGVTERFVNFLGGKIRIPNPTDVMNSDNNILTLHEICRLYLGINRDTAAVFSSYCNFKAYYHKFQSTGSSNMQFSVSHVDEGDDVTIYLKTPGHFYSVPDKRVKDSEETGDGVVKMKSKSKAEKKVKSKKKKASKHNKRVNLQNFDSETL